MSRLTFLFGFLYVAWGFESLGRNAVLSSVAIGKEVKFQKGGGAVSGDRASGGR